MDGHKESGGPNILETAALLCLGASSTIRENLDDWLEYFAEVGNHFVEVGKVERDKYAHMIGTGKLATKSDVDELSRKIDAICKQQDETLLKWPEPKADEPPMQKKGHH